MKERPRRCHAQRRAFSRYGLRLTALQLAGLVEDIQTGRALAVYKRSNSRWLCLLAVEGREAVVVYSRSRRSILTFLPKDCPEWQLLEEARKP